MELQIWQAILDYGALALLALIVIAWLRGLVVSRWQYDQMQDWYKEELARARREGEEWRRYALEAVPLVDRSLALAAERAEK